MELLIKSAIFTNIASFMNLKLQQLNFTVTVITATVAIINVEAIITTTIKFISPFPSYLSSIY